MWRKLCIRSIHKESTTCTHPREVYTKLTRMHTAGLPLTRPWGIGNSHWKITQKKFKKISKGLGFTAHPTKRIWHSLSNHHTTLWYVHVRQCRTFSAPCAVVREDEGCQCAIGDPLEYFSVSLSCLSHIWQLNTATEYTHN